MKKVYYVNNKIMNKIFKGEVIKNRVWNNETTGQSYSIEDCLELDKKIYIDFLNNKEFILIIYKSGLQSTGYNANENNNLIKYIIKHD